MVVVFLELIMLFLIFLGYIDNQYPVPMRSTAPLLHALLRHALYACKNGKIKTNEQKQENERLLTPLVSVLFGSPLPM
jgi:Gpi18-like mannosyltransferase